MSISRSSRRGCGEDPPEPGEVAAEPTRPYDTRAERGAAGAPLSGESGHGASRAPDEYVERHVQNSPHLRLERPADGVALLTLDNPDQRNAMSDEMTSSWVAADRRAGRRPLGARGRGDRRGHGVLLRRQHLLDRQRAGRVGRPPAHPDDRVLPGLAVDPPARGARRSPRSTGPAIGAGLCLALACDLRYAAGRRQARCAVREARHAPGHGGDLPAAERRRRGARPRPAADRTGGRRRRGAAARPGLAGASSRGVPRRGARDRRPGSPPPRRSPASSPSWRCRRRPRRPRERACSGRRWPSRSRWRPRTCRRASARRGEAARRSSRALSRRARTAEEAPGPPPDTCLPLASVRRRPGGLVCGHTLGAGAARVNAEPDSACGQGCGQTCGRRPHRWRTGLGRDAPVDRRPGRRGVPPADQRQWLSTGCGGKEIRANSGGDGRGEPYDGGPVAALRRIAFLLERGARGHLQGQGVPRRRRRDPAAAGRGGRAAAVEDGTPHRPARASGASSAKVIAAAVRGRGARAAGRAGARARRAADRRRRRAAGGAARRPALPLRLVRRRLADRGDGLHRDRARPRLPRADRPLAAADRRPRAQRRAADPPARRRRRGQRAPRAAAASRCSRGSRSTSSTTARWTRPTSCWPGSTSGWRACTPS